jgi:hypothetical protein
MFVPVFFVQLHPYFLAYVEVYLRTHFIMPFYIFFFFFFFFFFLLLLLLLLLLFLLLLSLNFDLQYPNLLPKRYHAGYNENSHIFTLSWQHLAKCHGMHKSDETEHASRLIYKAVSNSGAACSAIISTKFEDNGTRNTHVGVSADTSPAPR